MTPQPILLGICAGAISAIVFVSATTGPVLSRFVLFLLTPFSIYLAGLGLGVLPAAIAALTATLAILALTNPATALVFAVSEAAPAAGAAVAHPATEQYIPIGQSPGALTMRGEVTATAAPAAAGGEAERRARLDRMGRRTVITNLLTDLSFGEHAD